MKRFWLFSSLKSRATFIGSGWFEAAETLAGGIEDMNEGRIVAVVRRGCPYYDGWLKYDIACGGLPRFIPSELLPGY